MKLTRHRPDFTLFLVVVLLVLIGLVNIYSASTIVSLKNADSTSYYFVRQLIWVVLGLFLMLFTMNVPFTRWFKLSKLMMPASYFLLLCVLIPGIGKSIGGARRWLNLGPFSFQPTELAMISIILYIAYLLTKKRDRILDAKASFWPSIILIGMGFGMIMLEPDMGTAVIFATSPLVVMFVSGIPKKYLRNLMIIGIAACIPLAFMGYRGDRITAYLNPWNDTDGIGLQTIQSLYAIGTGGWTGRGLGHSIEKFSYLPEPHTDMIFAILSEEWGFFGGAALIVLFGILIWRGIHIATHVQDRFAGMVAMGITTMIGFAAFINIGSVSGLLPVIGVPLPFISYGGTALFMKMFSMGILLNISRYTSKEIALTPGAGESQVVDRTIPIRTSRFDT